MTTIQTIKDKVWTDETGLQIPSTRINAFERLRESSIGKILESSRKASAALVDLKGTIEAEVQRIIEAHDKEHGSKDAKPRKGNITLYSFNRAVKVEVSVQDKIDFDSLLIGQCQGKLLQFLDNNLDAKTEFVKDIVLEAFSTTKGNLDAKKVIGLLKFRSKIKAQLFQEALDLLEKSITNPSSKRYFRVYVRDEAGKYNAIELNFSNV